MCEEFSFISSNGHDKVYAWKFLPKKEQIGVIHLIHGFGEHTQRFSCIINYFNDSGFIVVADDHIGHGVTGICNKNLGVAFPVSYLLYLDDEKKYMILSKIIIQLFRFSCMAIVGVHY